MNSIAATSLSLNENRRRLLFDALSPALGSTPQTPADEQLGRRHLLYSNSIFQAEQIRPEEHSLGGLDPMSSTLKPQL